MSAHATQEYLPESWDRAGYMQATIALGDLIAFFVRPHLKFAQLVRRSKSKSGT